MGYATTLIVILIMTNIMLYFYGVDIGLSSIMSLGAQEYNEGDNPGEPTGSTSGGLGSANLLWTIVLIIGAAVVAGSITGISPSLYGSDTKMSFTIPLAMFMALGLFIVTPMGNIIGSVDAGNGMYCYAMRSDAVMFNMQANSACLPFELHILLIVFLGMLTIAALMTFVSGRDF